MMQPLSEKAKGKQRADPIPEAVFDNGITLPPRELMVRFTDGIQDLVLHVSEHDSVRDVKVKVCSSPPARILSPPHPIYPRIPIFSLKISSKTVSDPRRAPSTAAPPLAPHPRRAAPRRRDAARIMARHARRAPAARRDEGQGRTRPTYNACHCAARLRSPHAGTSAMATLLRRRPTLR